jgi:hypothetical protein
MSGVHSQPDGPAFDLVLLLHVACVVAGLATAVTSVATAKRLRRLAGAGAPLPDAVVRYFRPGVNWAGRVMYGIPVFGFTLLAMSQGAYSLSRTWVMLGLGIFVVVVLLAEGTLWPAERRLQVSVADLGDQPEAVLAPAALRDAQFMTWSATAVLVLLIAGTVIMVAQP